MLHAITMLSVKFRVLVLGAALVVLAVGLVRLPQASTDAYPEFLPPQVQVQTEAPGLSAAEVEQLVTVPLEQDLLNGVAWLDTVHSRSLPGLSSVDLVFQQGTDLLKARQAVQERLTQARALPNVGTPPTMVQPLSAAGRVLMIGLTSPGGKLTPVQLSTLARWQIKPRLMGIPGVANVVLWGQRDRQLQVQVDPARLRALGVTLDQVISTSGNAMWVSPLSFVEASTPGTGGFVETGSQRFAVQHILPISSPADLSAITVEGTGKRVVRLGDVADVVEGNQPLIGDAVLGDRAAAAGGGLVLVIEKFPGADTRQITRNVESALASMAPGLSGVSVDTSVYRPAGYLDSAIGHIGLWALIGAALFAAVLALTTRSWRAVLAGLFSLVLSTATALVLLTLLGSTLNLLVLAGLVLALAVVVEDCLAERSSPADRGPAVYGTLLVLLAALPLALLPGLTGAFTRPLVLAYALAVVCAALVALFVTPAIGSLLGSTGAPARGDRLLRRAWDATAGRVLPRRGWMYGVVALLLAGVLTVLPQLGSGSPSLLPALQDRDLLVSVSTQPGTSLTEQDRISTAVLDELLRIPGVAAAGGHAGRAVTADRTGNVDSGELWVRLAQSADYGSTRARIESALRQYPGIATRLSTFGQAQVDTLQSVDPDAPVVVRIYGQDLAVLGTQAEQVRQLLTRIPGVRSPQVAAQEEQPTVRIEVNLATAQRYGLHPGDVRRATAAYLAGIPVGSFYQDQQVFDVVVWSTPQLRRSPSQIPDLMIDAPTGGQVRLGDVASVQVVPYPTVITHQGTSRSLDVTARSSGRDLTDVLADVRTAVSALPMPLEYHAEVVSPVAQRQAHDLRTLWAVLAALLGGFLLLQAAFRSWGRAALVLLTLPLAAAGSVLVAPVAGAGGLRSAGALLGLLAVLLLTLRAAVPLLRAYQRQPGQVAEVTRERAAAVLQQRLALAALLAPLPVIGAVSGLELLKPLAVVLLGGLVSSTVLTLFLLPVLYQRFFAEEARPGEGD